MNIFSNNCIKNINLSKTGTGITLTGSFLINESDVPNEINIGSYKLKLKSIKKENHLLILTYKTDFTQLIFSSNSFETINKNIYTTLKENKLLQNYFNNKIKNENVSTHIKITEKENDFYLEEVGFSPSEIFNTYNLKVYYPPALEYKITKLLIPNNITSLSLIKTIFPFPIIINYITDDKIEIKIRETNFKITNICITNKQEKIIRYSTKIIGLPSRPFNVSEYSDETKIIEEKIGEDGITIKYYYIENIYGKVYAIIREQSLIEKFISPTYI